MRLISFKLGESSYSTGRHGRRRRRVQISVALIAVVGLTGCQSMNMNSAQVRVLDATTYPGTIDSYQDDTALAYNLGHGTVTSYMSSVTGDSTLALDRAGTRQALAAAKSTLLAGRQYTEIVTGTLVNMQATVLEDQSTPASSGHAAVRLINEADGTGPVDVYLVSRRRAGAAIKLATSPAQGANAGYIEVPAGKYALEIVPSGAGPASGETLYSGARIGYASGAVRTIVLIDTQTAMPHSSVRGVQAVSLDDADAL